MEVFSRMGCVVLVLCWYCESMILTEYQVVMAIRAE